MVVRLEPATTGVKSCRIATGNSLCGDVELKGTADVASACSVQPTTIDFGLVTVGSARDTTFTITNTGGGLLSGTVSETCDDISIVSGGGAYGLAADETLTVTLRFSPMGSGVHTCSVKTRNAMCSNVTVIGHDESSKIVGTAVGHLGVILRTTDGGATWVSQTSGTTWNLIGVSFTDVNTGTIVGQNGTILRTTDGGATWTGQISGTTDLLMAVSFTDVNTGTVVGANGTILRTTDGGATWVGQISGTPEFLAGVSFTDTNTGTVVGANGTILRTTDGGVTWVG